MQNDCTKFIGSEFAAEKAPIRICLALVDFDATCNHEGCRYRWVPFYPNMDIHTYNLNSH